MPMIWMPEQELRALQDILRHAETVDWDAYERAKRYLLNPQTEPVEEDAEPVLS